MASGSGIQLTFDSSQPAGSTENYTFGATDTGAPPDPIILDPDGLDGYGGASGWFKFENKTDFYVVLQTNTPEENFEFRVDDPLVFNHYGFTASADLSDNPYSPLMHNLGYVSNGFEFNATPQGSFIRHGEAAGASLDVPRSVLWHRHDVVSVQPYSRPVRDLQFELGYDDIEIIVNNGGVVNPTNYNLSFDSDITVDGENYDLNLNSGEDQYIKNYSWDFQHALYGTELQSMELSTDRNVLENNLFVNGSPRGFIVHEDIVADNTSEGDDIVADTRIWSGNLILKFDNIPDAYHSEFLFKPMVFDHVATASAEFAPLPVDVENNNSPNFNLTEGGSTLDFNLRSTVRADSIYGKNLKYNVLICLEESNPPLNTDNHNFEFTDNFLDKQCGALILNFSHGSYGQFQFDRTVFIEDIDPEHGHYAEVVLAASKNLIGDAFGGENFRTIFNTYPAALMDADGYTGCAIDIDLLTIAIIYDVNAYTGATTDLVLETYLAPELPSTAYHGQVGYVEILTEPVLQIDPVQNGAYADQDFTTFPSIELDAGAYHGQTSLSTILISANFDLSVYHGVYGVTDMVTFKSAGLGDVNARFGSDTVVDLAYTPTLDSDAHHGIDGAAELNFAATFDLDGYGGETGETDFTRVLAPELPMLVEHGSSGELVFLSVPKALFPRAGHGSAVDSALAIYPAQELEITAYHGIRGDLELVETEFNTFAHHGATLVDLTLQVTVNFPTEPMGHGATAEGDEIKRGPTLDMDTYHGSEGFLSNFVVPEGETILANAYAGQAFTPSLEAPIHARFDLYPIVASQSLRDGLGGVGGINHCFISSDDLDPVYGDNVTRLGYDPIAHVDDKLIIRFDDIGDDPWNVCNGGGMDFEVGLLTNQRLEANAYAGESVRTFFPLEVMPLFGSDVPLDRLYQWEYWAVIVREVFELEEIKYETSAAVWDHPDDFVAFYESYFSAELTPTAFAPMYHGAYANADFTVPVYGWKHAQKPIETGEHLRLEFEPVDYIRFCKGYIVPNGNSLVFEFTSYEESDCSIVLGAFGQALNKFDLHTFQNPEVRGYGGQNARATLTVQTYWTLYARHGAHVRAQFYEEPEFMPNARAGSYAQFKFYEPPILGYGGECAFIDEIVIPGADVEWVTETQCLPNDYKPLTPDGDIDYELLKPDSNGVLHFPNVPVEGKPYLATVLAQCISYAGSDNGD